MVLVALTKAEIRQRRWVKQRISYIESDNARIIKLLSDRISDLEFLLTSPSGRLPQVGMLPIPVPSGAREDPAEERPWLTCDGCAKHWHRGASDEDVRSLHADLHQEVDHTAGVS